MDLFGALARASASETAWSEKTVKRVGETTLDRIHQSMILFATGRDEARSESILLAVQDTTSLNYTTPAATEGICPIGTTVNGPQ